MHCVLMPYSHPLRVGPPPLLPAPPGGPGVELWQRLVGRLAARRAYKRLRLLLYWLQQELAFSEGCEERINWMSEAVRARARGGGGVHLSTLGIDVRQWE